MVSTERLMFDDFALVLVFPDKDLGTPSRSNNAITAARGVRYEQRCHDFDVFDAMHVFS